MKYNPNSKIVILLCEPAARAFSDYSHFHRNIANNNPYQLLGLAVSNAFSNENLTFPEYINGNAELLSYKGDMSKVLKTLGNLDALLFETFDGFDHLTTNSSFKAYKTEVIDKFILDIEKLGFSPNVLPLFNGMYHYYMKNWIETYGKENVLVLSSQDLLQNPYKTMKEFESFFNLDDYFTENMFKIPYGGEFYCIDGTEAATFYKKEMPTEWPFKFIKPKKHWNPETGKDDLLICLGDNKGKTRSKEKPKDIEDAIEKLKNIYKSHNEVLFEMIGKEFLWN